MIKLLYITNSIIGSGGLERVLSVKASLLTKQYDYDVHIMVLNETNPKPFYEFSPKIKYHTVFASGNPLKYLWEYYSGIKKVLKDTNPDIISVCDDGLKGTLFNIIFNIKNIPVIYERHVSKEVEKAKYKSTLKSKLLLKAKYWLMDFGIKKFDRFIVLTEGNKKEWNAKNIMVIPNPLPFKNNKISTLNTKKVLVVGKQSYQKGYDRLLKIWKKISKKHKDWELEVYGKVDKSLGLDRLTMEMKITDSVHFYPPVKDIEKKYLGASIYLMTSRYEGFGMVLIEAMSFGIPCISFDCPYGPADIIINEEDGFLIPNGDIDFFSKKLSMLINSIELRKKFGENALVNVKRFNSDVIVLKWDKLFKKLINEKN